MGFWSTVGNVLGSAATGNVLGIAGSIGSALIGGASSSSAIDKQNAANLQLQREQQEWQEKMTNQQNEYNSAKSQVERYKEAGINPYMAMMGSNATAGLQSSIGSPTSVGHQVANNAWGNAFSDMASKVATNIATLAQASKTNAETDAQKIENTYADQMAAARLEQLGLGNTYLSRTVEDRVAMAASDAALRNLQVSRQNIDNDMAQLQKDVYEKFGSKMKEAELNKLNAEISRIASETALNIAKKGLTYAQTRESISAAVRNYAQAHNLDVSSSQIEQLTPQLVAQATAQAGIMKAEEKYSGEYFWNRNNNLKSQGRLYGSQVALNKMEEEWRPFVYGSQMMNGTANTVTDIINTLSPNISQGTTTYQNYYNPKTGYSVGKKTYERQRGKKPVFKKKGR